MDQRGGAAADCGAAVSERKVTPGGSSVTTVCMGATQLPLLDGLKREKVQ